MADSVKTPWHLWLVGVLSLLWNGFGAFDFTATVTRYAPYMAQFPEEMKEFWYSSPPWLYVIWAVGVWGAFLGSILLLMRNKLAVWALWASAAAAFASLVTSYLRPPPGGFAPAFPALIVVIALSLAAYAAAMTRRGVLR